MSSSGENSGKKPLKSCFVAQTSNPYLEKNRSYGDSSLQAGQDLEFFDLYTLLDFDDYTIPEINKSPLDEVMGALHSNGETNYIHSSSNNIVTGDLKVVPSATWTTSTGANTTQQGRQPQTTFRGTEMANESTTILQNLPGNSIIRTNACPNMKAVDSLRGEEMGYFNEFSYQDFGDFAFPEFNKSPLGEATETIASAISYNDNSSSFGIGETNHIHATSNIIPDDDFRVAPTTNDATQQHLHQLPQPNFIEMPTFLAASEPTFDNFRVLEEFFDNLAPEEAMNQRLLPQTNFTDLQMARRNSLQRFMNRRKERIAARKPYKKD